MRGWMLSAAGAVMIAAAHAAPPTPAEVVAAERAFAADGQARGWIAAFKKYAAPDAIAFQPDPVNVQESFKNRPDEPADRSLKWWPIWAGIATSGDLGFTTGPYTVGDTRFGSYFTVWAKQADGTWRWIYDGGPRHEAASPHGPDTEPAHLAMATAAAGSAATAWAEIGEVEAKFAAAAQQNTKAAYLVHLSADARIMGSPAQPATTAAERSAELDRRADRVQSAWRARISGGRSRLYLRRRQLDARRRGTARPLCAHLAEAQRRLEARVRRASRRAARTAAEAAIALNPISLRP